ncbi:hypothetical protein GCM10011588_58020 [Nocardia jinanensis]|uniref:Uncharacterized protein n=1 Tax=Nocardia jinanensis TaxID=382504 RepID=A0A917VWU6_9NOCA|nr:hypothetical protein GCM10011588_58020 [Nocardia jinanensis]
MVSRAPNDFAVGDSGRDLILLCNSSFQQISTERPPRRTFAPDRFRCGAMVDHPRRTEPDHTALRDRAIRAAAEFATGDTAALRPVAPPRTARTPA